MRIGDNVVDLAARTIHDAMDPDGPADVRLTPTEWHLLEVLLRNPGRLVSRRQLLHEVWGPADHERQPAGLHGTAATQAGTRPAPTTDLLNEPGMGYRFAPGDC